MSAFPFRCRPGWGPQRGEALIFGGAWPRVQRAGRFGLWGRGSHTWLPPRVRIRGHFARDPFRQSRAISLPFPSWHCICSFSLVASAAWMFRTCVCVHLYVVLVFFLLRTLPPFILTRGDACLERSSNWYERSAHWRSRRTGEPSAWSAHRRLSTRGDACLKRSSNWSERLGRLALSNRGAVCVERLSPSSEGLVCKFCWQRCSQHRMTLFGYV